MHEFDDLGDGVDILGDRKAARLQLFFELIFEPGAVCAHACVRQDGARVRADGNEQDALVLFGRDGEDVLGVLDEGHGLFGDFLRNFLVFGPADGGEPLFCSEFVEGELVEPDDAFEGEDAGKRFVQSLFGEDALVVGFRHVAGVLFDVVVEEEHIDACHDGAGTSSLRFALPVSPTMCEASETMSPLKPSLPRRRSPKSSFERVAGFKSSSLRPGRSGADRRAS